MILSLMASRRPFQLLLKVGVFFALFLTGMQQVQAYHIVGGEINYRCLGNNLYEITLHIYRDCTSVGNPPNDPAAFFDSLAYITIYDDKKNAVDTIEMRYRNVNDTLNQQLSDPCFFLPSTVCVHTTTYVDTILLNTNLTQDGFHISYQRCCRNDDINNIEDDELTGSTYTMYISKQAILACNNAPTFREWPPLFVCQGKPLDYDHSATDIEGDSIVYRLYTPYAGATKTEGQPIAAGPPEYPPITWASGFGVDNMLGFGEPLKIDSLTGLLTAIPGSNGKFLVGVYMSEYRDGVLFSEIRRDFQFVINTCGSPVAAYAAPDGQCEDLSVMFENTSSEYDDFQWYFSQDSMIFDSSDVLEPTYLFPDTGTYEATLVVSIFEDCRDTFSQSITLVENRIQTGYDLQSLNCGDSSLLSILDLSTDPDSDSLFYEWTLYTPTDTLFSTAQNPNFFIPATMDSVTLVQQVTSVFGCITIDTTRFELTGDDPTSFLQDTLYICLGESVPLNPDFMPGFAYEWSPDSFLTGGITNANPVAMPPDDITYNVLITDSSGTCQLMDEVTVVVFDLQLDFDIEYSCNGFTVDFVNTTQDGVAYTWDFGDPGTNTDVSDEVSPTYTYDSAGTYTVTLMSLPGLPCQIPDTLVREITVGTPVVLADFQAEYLQCDSDSLTVKLTNTSSIIQGDIVSISWYIDGMLISKQDSATYTITQTDTVDISMEIVTSDSCIDIAFLANAPLVLPDDGGLQDSVLSCVGTPTELWPNAPDGLHFQWSPIAGLDDPTLGNPTANPDVSTTYTVAITGIGLDTCTIVRDVFVLVNEPLDIDLPMDTSSCEDAILLSANVNGGVTYEWRDSSGNVIGIDPEITLSPGGAHIYTIHVEDELGCINSDTVEVYTGGLNLQVDDPLILCLGTTDRIVVNNVGSSDVLTYEWQPASEIISGGNTNMPVISVASPGVRTFTYRAENQFGCETMDTIEVVVVDTGLTAAIIQTRQCEPLTIEFTNTNDFYAYYTWDFGDATNPDSIASGQTVSYQYPTAGIYTVRLYLQDSHCQDTIVKEIEVLDGDITVANFGFVFDECAVNEVTIQFSDSSFHAAENVISWDWYLFDDLFSTAQNPTLTVDDDQIIEVTLVMESESGCMDTLTRTIDIADVPDINLPDTLLTCATVPVFLNPSGNPAYAYVWSPAGLLDDANAANPQASVSTPTDFVVTITVPSGSGFCVYEETVHVAIGTLADVVAMDDFVSCQQTVELTATTNMATSVEWFDEDGQSIGTGSPITVSPSGNTTYFVRAYDMMGCYDEDSVVVSGNAVDAALSVNTLTLCQYASAEVRLINLDPADDLSVLWSPSSLISGSNSDTVVTVQSDQAGTFTLFADVSNTLGCLWRDTISVNVNGADVTALDDFITCEDKVLISATTNVGAVITWTTLGGGVLGNGTSIEVSPVGYTTYIATSQNTSTGCMGIDTVTVGGFGIDAAISADSILACQFEELYLSLVNTDTTEALVYQWRPSSLIMGSSVVNPVQINTNSAGSFIVVVDALNLQGCAISDTAYITLLDADIDFDFDYSLQCDGVTVQFDNLSTGIDDFVWNFGDNTPLSTVDNPIHTYLAAGTYTVQLTSSTMVSCIDTLEREIIVPDTFLDADFALSYEDCSSEEVTVVFSNTSVNPLGDIVSWNWYFGDNLASQNSTFTRTFTSNTQLRVTLIVETEAGCIDSITRDVTIDLVPDFELADTVVTCAGLGAFLNPDPVAGVEYLWSPSEGLDDPTSPNPFANPTQTTVYTVSIRKITADTCERIDAVTALVPSPLDINLPADDQTCDTSYTLSGSSDGSVIFEWLNGDGTLIDTGQTIVVSPMNATDYIARVTDVYGCITQDTVSIFGAGIDVAVPDQITACSGDSVVLELQNLDVADIVQYSFDPDDAVVQFINNERVIIFVDTPGTLDFCVTAINQHDCERTLCLPIHFNDTTGLAGSLHYGQCEPQVVRFLSTHPQADRLIWIFGDPANPMASDTGAMVSYTYAQNGDYTVRVILEGPEECAADITLPISVVDGPYFDLGYATEVVACDSPAMITFIDTSSHVQDDISEWLWIFSSGDTVVGPIAELMFQEEETLTFNMQITSIVGCEADYSGSYEVEIVNPQLTDSLGLCSGESIALNPNANDDYDYVWSPDVAISSTTASNPIVNPAVSTVYTAAITSVLTSGDTCSISRSVNVEVHPLLSLETPDDLVFCEPANVTLSTVVSNADSVFYAWSLTPDFNSILSDSASVSAVTGRPNTYYLRVTDTFGCAYFDTILVGNYATDVEVMQDTFLCEGENIQLSATNLIPGDILNYFWEPEAGILRGEETATPTVSPDSTITYYVEYSNQFGCSGLDSIEVTVGGTGLSELTAIANPDTISYGRNTQLQATLRAAYAYQWFPASSLTYDNIHNPYANPETTTDYTVVITSDDGCETQRLVTVTVVQRPCEEPYIFVPRAFTPNLDGTNDMLFVYGNPIDELLFIIYNRWGEEVFRTTDINRGWDGRYKGVDLPSDVFGYYLEVRCFDGETFLKKGNVSLLR